MEDPQKVDVINAMGLEHQEYQNMLYSFALSAPSNYSKLRTSVVSEVKIKAIKALHKSFYDLLKYGKVNGTEMIRINGTAVHPKYPEHELNEFCYGICQSMEKAIDKALEIILARDAEAILRSKYAQVGAMPTEPAV